jgi:hypothetical protein
VGPARFYEPSREGAEAEVADRLEGWRRGAPKPSK